MLSRSSSHRSENFCISTTRRLECINHWTIRNFKRRCEWLEQNQALVSSPFAVDINGKIIWVLALRRLYRDFELSLTLNGSAHEDANLPTDYEFIIKSASSEKSLDFKGERCFKVKESAKHYFQIGMLEMEQKLELDDDITITCNLVVSAEFKNWSHRFPPKPRDGTCKFEDDFLRLLESGEFSDISIEADGICFKAHKAILISRSEYFRAMLSHNTVEANTNQVKVSDIDSQVMRAVLRFIYSGSIDCKSLSSAQELPEGEENHCIVDEGEENHMEEQHLDEPTQRHSFVIDLLKAADRYRLDDLKLHCELALCDRMSARSAPDLLKLAHIYRAENLKSRLIQFTILHANEVNELERLRTLLKEYPELSVELFVAQHEALATGLEPRATRVNVQSETSN